MKEESVWHKVNKNIPMEYAATITVNPLTALRMMEDFVGLKAGSELPFSLYFKISIDFGIC